VPSSGSSAVHAELQADLGLWLITFCVVRGCVFIVPRACADRRTMNTQPRTTHNFINHRAKSACNSAGTGELPEDGTQVPKHVGATEWQAAAR
jgi:hypothetical protein